MSPTSEKWLTCRVLRNDHRREDSGIKGSQRSSMDTRLASPYSSLTVTVTTYMSINFRCLDNDCSTLAAGFCGVRVIKYIYNLRGGGHKGLYVPNWWQFCPWEYLTTSGDSLGCHNSGNVLRFSGQRPGMLPSTLQQPRQKPATKNCGPQCQHLETCSRK